MAYKIKQRDSEETFNLWHVELEIFVALLAKKLSEVRGLDSKRVVNEINFQYLRKTNGGEFKNYGATRLQRSVLSGKGY